MWAYIKLRMNLRKKLHTEDASVIKKRENKKDSEWEAQVKDAEDCADDGSW